MTYALNVQLLTHRTTCIPWLVDENQAQRSHCFQHGKTQARSVPRKGKDDASKKQPAVMNKRATKPETAGKSGDATSDGSIPPTLVGEDDTILLQ